VWYFTPFYSILRAASTYELFGLPGKMWGMFTMAGAVAILFVVPWLDRSPVKSMRYKGWLSRIALLLFVAAFIILGVLGTKIVAPARTVLAQICTLYYFAFFIAMPWYTRMEKTTTPPARLTGRFITIPQLVLTLVLIAGLTSLPLMAVGAEAEAQLEPFKVNLQDKASLQSGAATFINNCMGCHSASFARYQRLADDLGIPKDVAEKNLLLSKNGKLGDLMVSSMPKEAAQNWFGSAPPDLTLVARVRSPAWLNGYLKGFYLDSKRPFGVNNTVFKNVGMPNVLGNLQGQQTCDGEHCTVTTHVEGTGTMTPAEFDKFVYDLVNFLAYLGEPAGMNRQTIGAYVLFFLAFLFVFAYMLNREYWKDVH
jgi:ubiquinol-cytochrome c reductase cytochrome b subunit